MIIYLNLLTRLGGGDFLVQKYEAVSQAEALFEAQKEQFALDSSNYEQFKAAHVVKLWLDVSMGKSSIEVLATYEHKRKPIKEYNKAKV